MGKNRPILVSQLDLSLDHNLIKCKDGLEYADLETEVKFPVLLPKKCNRAKMIREVHEKVGHMGLNTTVGEVGRRYWILQIRQPVKGMI